MKIGIISDTHDNTEALQKAIELLKKQNAEVLIHCGDFCAPFMMAELAKFPGKIHAVFGNIDDRYLTTLKAQEAGIKLHGDLAELEIDGKKIAVNHFPRIAEALAQAHIYDLVCYGHTHKAEIREVGNTLLINPGEILGRLGKRSLAIYDTKTGKAEIITLAN
jgi:putative phosphoesterase